MADEDTTAVPDGSGSDGSDPFSSLLSFGVDAFNTISADVNNSSQPTQKAAVTNTPAPVPVGGTKSNWPTMVLLGIGAIVVLKVLRLI